MYSPKVLEHFQNPHNQGKIENADGIGEVGNPVCGDMMKIYLKIKRSADAPNFENDIIEDIKFETLGCGAAIASTSMLTDLAKGKTISDALKITKKDVVNELGGLPEVKVHCSLLAVDGLKKATQDYLDKNNN